jgi:hypothetical protein
MRLPILSLCYARFFINLLFNLIVYSELFRFVDNVSSRILTAFWPMPGESIARPKFIRDTLKFGRLSTTVIFCIYFQCSNFLWIDLMNVLLEIMNIFMFYDKLTFLYIFWILYI